MPYTDTFQQLASGALVLTANRRLARILRRRYGVWQQTRGRDAWPSPEVLYWSDWLDKLWSTDIQPRLDGARPRGVLLTASQGRRIWEQVIQGSPQAVTILSTADTAHEAQHAWNIIQDWRLPMVGSDWDRHPDLRAFKSWADRFVQHCRSRSWFGMPQLTETIGACFQDGSLPAPACVLLAGFDELSPSQRWLITILEEQRCDVREVAMVNRQETALRTSLPSPDLEILCAAKWARQIVLRDPSRTVGIVVPDLNAYRDRILTIFEDILHPAFTLPGPTRGERCFNLSLGSPLADYPVIHTALLILRFAQVELPLDQAGSLLRSPFLAGAETEMTLRAMLDARLRDTGRLMVTLDDVRRFSGEKTFSCPNLTQSLERLLSVRKDTMKRQAPSQWAGIFSDLLSAAGWPGQRSLDSEEYQTVEAWKTLLDALASLSIISASMSFDEAMTWVANAAANRIFQPEQPDTPIQVLGLLETAGIDFDHLWVMGMHDGCWPPKAAPNPFIPMRLGRQYGIPHAVAEREWDRAKRLTDRLVSSAREVIISYPATDGDRPLHVSPLIVQVTEIASDALLASDPPTLCDRIRQSVVLESFCDDSGPPVPPDLPARATTGLFKDQAACPFRAFAIHRLGAQTLGEARAGLDPAQRGVLVHRALQALWSRLRTQQRLILLGDEALGAYIGEAVQDAIAFLRKKNFDTFPNRFTRLEGERVEDLLRRWLETECEREPFEVVDMESEHPITIDGFQVRMRIDRIDRLEDGRLAVVDYKTGLAEIKDWFGGRPDEPQLPLYALALDADGVAFARVAKKTLDYRGLTSGVEMGPGIQRLADSRYAVDYDTWEALIDAWRDTFTHLGRQYRAGHAQVDPKDPKTTCRYCTLAAFCRIDEHLGKPDPDE